MVISSILSDSRSGSPGSNHSSLLSAKSSVKKAAQKAAVDSPVKPVDKDYDEFDNLTEDIVNSFEERFQIHFSLAAIFLALDDAQWKLLNQLIKKSSQYCLNIETLLTLFKFYCLSNQKHKTLDLIGLFICDVEQLVSFKEYFCWLTRDHEESLVILTVEDSASNIFRVMKKFLKYAIFPPVESKYIKPNVYSLAKSFQELVMEMMLYLVQRLVILYSRNHNSTLLHTLIRTLCKVEKSRQRKYSVTSKLEQWLDEPTTCTACYKDIGIVTCVRELYSKKKWHLDCAKCEVCKERLFGEEIMYAGIDSQDKLKCSGCNLSSQAGENNIGQFRRVLMEQQAVYMVKKNMLSTVQELEDDRFGYICQEWIQYWRMDADDLKQYDIHTQKAQSGVFELIHRQQFFVDSAAEFLKIGDKYLKDAKARPEELDVTMYDLIFKPLRELRHIHKRTLLSPMTRFLFDQGMVIKYLIFRLYIGWMGKSCSAYEDYLVKLAESELLLDLDKVKEVPHMQNWIKEQNSAKFEKLLLGEFYYQIIQTKEILKSIEKHVELEDPENAIVFQTSQLVEEFSYQLHKVLDRAVTRAYLSRIQNLEVKRKDVSYKKHVFVKYKSKVTNEVLDCCLILLNVCLVISKLSFSDNTFVKFAPIIYVDNLVYDLTDAKVLISDKSKDTEGYKFYFKNENEAENWVNSLYRQS